MLKKKKSKKRKVDDDFIKLTTEPQNKNNNKHFIPTVPSISVKPSSTNVEEGEWNKVKSKRRIKTRGKLGTQAAYQSQINVVPKLRYDKDMDCDSVNKLLKVSRSLQ
ncbi:hypothetical protein Zmor_021712 [Zophobas morio]|uniref:Uncharacterized protein n=1 Tax=Zophobas morio TaxID=2755281 RepID=A0AA38I6S9_9CUCU|nr:hypothetical protein Zmor_021712 [Zophobas morio]